MKQLLLIAVVGVVAGAAGFGIYRSMTSKDQPMPAAKAPSATAQLTDAGAKPSGPVTMLPDISLPNREGTKQSLHSWPGKSMIVNFWATWCGPCRKEIPLLKQVAQQEGKAGFQLVGIAIDYRDDVLKFAQEVGIDYPILIGEEEGTAAADAFGVDSVGLPFTAFTDDKGHIVTIYMGELTRSKIDTILGAVKKVNRGELTPDAARVAIAKELGQLQG